MSVTVEWVEKELNVPRDLLLRDGMKRYLEFELRRLEIDAAKIRRRYGVKTFDDLWGKLESGEVSEGSVSMVSPDWNIWKLDLKKW